jgi:hypothetical protein
MKRIAISLLFALLFALGMVGHAVTVQQVDGGEKIVVNWNSRVKK